MTRPAEENREKCRAYREALKARVLARYGESCRCCGSTGDLTIDHIDGTGREHRMKLFGREDHGGQHFYRLLILWDFPPGYQTLCRSCNASKRRTARCRMDHAEAA
jgi:hypothetical protein